MDIQRAKEIIDSPVMVSVRYRAIPVYLKDIHNDNQTATVFPLDEMNHEQTVDVAGLYEDGLTH